MQKFSERSYRNKVARMSNGSGLWNQEGSHDKWQMKFEEDSEKWKFSPCSFRKRMEKRWCAINWVLITFDIEEDGIMMVQLLKSTSPKQELQEFFSTKLWKAHRMFLLFCHIRLPSSGNLFEIMVALTAQTCGRHVCENSSEILRLKNGHVGSELKMKTEHPSAA